MLLLGILALILLLGNAYLYFFPLNNRNRYVPSVYSEAELDEWENSLKKLHRKNSHFEKRIINQERAVSRKLKSLDTSILNLDSKTENIRKRIKRIESLLSTKSLNKGNKSNTAKKIEKLEDFKRNAIIELQAIKEVLPELKKSKNEQNPDLEEKIHNLVFHGKAKNN